jgi:hypothetical protein
MRYEYKFVEKRLLPDLLAQLDVLGKDGWELASQPDQTSAILKRGICMEIPQGTATACANCAGFKPAETLKSLDSVGWCEEWKLAMNATGRCDRFHAIPGGTHNIPAGSVPDENSAWHWQPRTEFGEKRVEAITDLVSGVLAPEHKHRVLVIASKDGCVVRGKTDMVNGHEHPITTVGMVDEADGHTHTFDIPRG